MEAKRSDSKSEGLGPNHFVDYVTTVSTFKLFDTSPKLMNTDHVVAEAYTFNMYTFTSLRNTHARLVEL